MGSGNWTRIARIAGAQHGAISVAQLYACGLSSAAISRAVQRGHLFRLHRGVYAVGHLGIGAKTRWKAATIAGGPAAFISHRAAAEAQEMLREAGRRIIDITVAKRSGRRRPGLRIHRVQSLRADETHRIHGIPCTSPARTIIDIAGSEPRRHLEWAIRAGEGRKTLRAKDVARALAWHPFSPGAALVTELMRLDDPIAGKSRSDLEIIFFDLCEGFGLPLPEVNVKIDANGARHEVDFSWPDLGLAIETDGRQWHEGQFATSLDEVRDRDLTIAGWRVQRLTWRQIILDPDGAAAIIGALIDQQRAALQRVPTPLGRITANG